jgi:hypothetical protein
LIWRSPLICSVLLNCLGHPNTDYSSKQLGDTDEWKSHPLKVFLWTSSSRFCQFGSFVHRYGSGFDQSVRFCWKEEGVSNRSEVHANANFSAKLSKKEIKKMDVRLGSVKSNCLSYRGCITHLNCCKVSEDISYKALQGIYK